MTRSSSRKLATALIVIGAVLLLAGRKSPPPRGQYVAEAILQVVRAPSDSGDAVLHQESSFFESTALLDGVISNLNLTAKWSVPNAESSLSDIRRRLRSSLEVSTSDASDQIRVRVSGRDKPETEDIASSVLRVYQELRRAHLRESKPKAIVTLEDQLEDIEPRLKLAIETMERVGKDLTITDLYVPPRPDPTLLDRIRDGKEEDEPGNTSSLFNSDPVPKNETPEEVKRRIYLKSRRLAEVLSYRKQRAEARLEIERRRHSTSESASVQVVQTPEAIPQTSTAASRPGRAWSVVGWTCVALGLIGFVRSRSAPASSI
jgi:hypothetical protein